MMGASAESTRGKASRWCTKKANGGFEYFFATAGAKGNVKFDPLYELSPFMLVKGTMVYTPEYGVLRVPKTDDSGFPLWFIPLFISGACVSLLFMRRRGCKNM